MKKLNTYQIVTLIAFIFSANSIFSQTLVKDIRSGQDGSRPFVDKIQEGNTVYFISEDGGDRTSLYKTDGSSVGTVALVSNSNFFTNKLFGLINDDLFFMGGYVADNIGVALYKVNVNSGILSLVKDINPIDVDFTYLSGASIQLDNGSFVFLADDGVHGYEPWITDGTNSGTRLIKDINTNGNSLINTSYEKYFAKIGNTFFFGAGDTISGAELWKSDGTTLGTVLVKDIEPGVPLFAGYGSNPAFFTTYNGKVYFSAFTTNNGRELWVSDGTANGTQMVKDLAVGDADPRELTVFDGNLYFSAKTNNDGVCLYKSNGTSVGTAVIKTPIQGGPSGPYELTIFKGKLYMSGDDTNGGYFIYNTDGSTFSKQSIGDFASNLLATSNYLYFGTYDLNGKYQIYRNDGNTISKLTNSSSITVENEPICFVNNCLLLVGDDGNTGGEIYSICGQQSQPLNITESNLEKNYSIYPNPANDHLFVKLESSSIQKVQLFSVDGRHILNEVIIGSENEIRLKLPLTLPTGLYSLQVFSQDKLTIKSKIAIVR